jgi:hypothetical protein
VARLARWLLDRRVSCVRALRGDFDDPGFERATFQNCWSWALKRWMIDGGHLVLMLSPRARVIRACWAPQGDKGPLWHFEPLHPKLGIKAIWHAFLHLGRPKNMR